MKTSLRDNSLVGTLGFPQQADELREFHPFRDLPRSLTFRTGTKSHILKASMIDILSHWQKRLSMAIFTLG
ncbi:MAG: hypothetical protein AB9897_03440 [Anaerolineaceae bacterium]